jgi:microcompartment protein CcmK/EutM
MPWVAAVLVSFAVLSHRYPAMIDLPLHEEIVASMRHFGDAARYPAGLLRWNLGHPNQLFYFVSYAVSLALPVDFACKLVVAASAAGVPLAAARLADHLGVSRAASLVAAPLGLGFFFYFGFVGNLLALGLLLALLPGLDRLARAPSPRSAAWATGALLVLYLAHDSALVIGAVAVVVLSAGRPLRERATLWRVVPLAVGGALALAQEVYAVRHNGANLRALPQVIDLGLDQKLDQMPRALLGLHGVGAVGPAFWAIAACLAALVAQRVNAARKAPRPVLGSALYDAHRFVVLGVVLVVAYFEVPFAYAGAMWLHARFLGPAVAVLGVSLAPRLPVRPWWPMRWAAAVAVLLVVRLVEPELTATSKVYADLDALMTSIAPGSAIAALDVVGGPSDDLVFTVAGASARAVTERGGRMAASFTQTSPIPAVVIAPEHRWEDSLLRLSQDTLSFEPARDLRLFRYVLAWTLPGQEEKLTAALAPEARIAGRSGGWVLYESTLAVGSVVGEEEGEGGESVRERLGRGR